MPPRRLATLGLVLAFLGISRVAHGHLPLYGVGTASRLIFKEDKVLITFDLSYADIWAQGEMLSADSNKSSAIEEPEADAYVEKQWADKIAPRLKARLDGQEAPIRKAAQRHEGLVGEIYGVPFSLYYELEVDIPGGKDAPGAPHTFELEDSVVRDETPAKPQFFIPYLGHGSSEKSGFKSEMVEPETSQLDPASMSYLLVGPKLTVKFHFAGSAGGARALASAPQPLAGASPQDPSRAGARKPLKPWDIDEMMARYDELRWWEILPLMLLAVLYGAGHALAPGHGKSMVAAYLIGTKGRVRDAVILGTVTTLTHTGSVFLFGLAVFFVVNSGTRFSEGSIRNMVIVSTQMLAGLLLVFMGLYLFYRRTRGIQAGHGHSPDPGHEQDHGHSHAHGEEHGHSHSHSHSHEHEHEHGHGHSHGLPRGFYEGGAPRMRDLLTIGFTGGIVPCPAGLTVILIAMRHPERLLFGLTLLVCFSVGLGSVLVAIGLLLISGRAIARPQWLNSPWLRRLPALSALFVAALGAYFCVITFQSGKQPLQALLRLAADWLE